MLEMINDLVNALDKAIMLIYDMSMHIDRLIDEAAEAIEALQVENEQLKADCDRMCGYEDSQMTPEEVQSLAKAKAEGRLVILPCKVGDTVYHRSGQHTIDDIQLFYPRQNGHVPEERIGKLQIRLGSLNYAGLQTFATYADEIGKTVFLTREEAEKALGGAEDGK